MIEFQITITEKDGMKDREIEQLVDFLQTTDSKLIIDLLEGAEVKTAPFDENMNAYEIIMKRSK